MLLDSGQYPRASPHVVRGVRAGASFVPVAEPVVSVAVVDLAQSAGAELRGRGDVRVDDATHDSRAVSPGVLFCAIPGGHVDGHDFAVDAVRRGANALLVERFLDIDVPQLRVPAVLHAVGPIAAQLHDHPSRAMRVAGVTGTNGKTTVTYLVEGALGAAGWGSGVIGTVEIRIHGAPQPPIHTTPEATDLQRLLAVMRDRGVDGVAMEVSSHGLDQHRTDGTAYAVAVFTNLTHDHLDYHGSLDAYFRAKARLFTPELSARGVVCIDDEWGRRLAREATIPVETYGRDETADHVIESIDVTPTGTFLRLRHRSTGEGVELSTRLLGAHNAGNAAAAFLAATAMGVPEDAAVAGIGACPGVPGRLEPVDGGQPFTVLVDYAHTPDALSHALVAARALAGDHRVHVVVGCGGDRDQAKRPEMGRVAATADRAVLTSDNPRSEDPGAILEEVVAGARRVAGGVVEVEVDRASAIAIALDGAGAGDVVLIAGKGHEVTQEANGVVIPFDDREVAGSYLARRWGGR